MPTVVQFRRGTTGQNNLFTGAVGELSVDTDLSTLRVHDGSTAGGAEIVNVSSAQTISNKIIGSHLLPAADSAYDLGDSAVKWRDLYLSGNTIYLGDALIHSTGSAVRLPVGSIIGSGGALLDSASALGILSGVTITAGSGLTGGGTIAASRTLNIGQGTGITVAADAISTNDGQIVHDNLSGFVADEHVAHSGVTITAGSGLTGGGTIAASRTLNVGAGTGVTVSADAIAIGQDVATSADVIFGTVTTTGNITVGGDLQVNGTTTTISSENYSVSDNMIYMNAGESDGSPTFQIDVGWAANVNDNGSYTHVGMFRDATDDRFKVFGAYTPEPDAALEINTGHASFALADFQAATFYGALSGNASTATALATGRTISLTGDVTGTSASFNGTGNVSITAALAANTVTSSELSGATSLIIYNSAGTALKTLYGAGS